MKKDLTNSLVDRQNILNNPFALDEIRKTSGVTGFLFKGEYRFTKEQLAQFFEVDLRTIERYLEKYSKELLDNGYEVLRGNALKELKLWVKNNQVADINVSHLTANLVKWLCLYCSKIYQRDGKY